jgi:tight adherence protein B
LGTRISHLLRDAGISTVTPLGLVSLCVVSGVVAGCAVLVVSRTPPVAVAFALLAGYTPVAVARGRVRSRRRELAEVWPEAVDNLASAVRAGLSLPEALAQLGERGPEPLRAEFAAFGRDYMASGRFSDCLDRLKETLADPVGDRVVEGLRIAREVGGGDLGRMLRSLSRFLREDARTRSELESRQAWVVNGARLATASPWAVLLALSLQPEVIGRYRSTAGVVVLCIGAAACFVAYRGMVRVGRLPDERRVLQ